MTDLRRWVGKLESTDAELSGLMHHRCCLLRYPVARAFKHSFQLQGGLISAAERAAFESSSYWRSAVRLRRWDDLAKAKDLRTPGLERYRVFVRSCLK